MKLSIALMALMSCGAALAAPLSEEWPTYGHDYGDTRHSPLAQITPANVGQLKPAWTYHMKPPGETPVARPGSRRRASAFNASEATPLVADGVMYIPTPYGRVVALDATTGTEKWAYQVPDNDQPATRGVSYWPGGGGAKPEIIFGTRDHGYLIALDAASGAPVKGFGEGGVVKLQTPDVMQGLPDAALG